MKNLKISNILLLILLAGACSKDMVIEQTSNEVNSLKSAIPHMKIAFIGGLSYLDPTLMVNCLNPASKFMSTLSNGNDVEELCKPIIDKAVSQILAEKPDMLLITGELSWKGEKISHEAVAGILQDISGQGIKVFVIPGNADINNINAKAYYELLSSPTPSVTEEEFEDIYGDFGFNNAISRDPNSLSYLTEAFNNVWILGIDARIYPIARNGLIKPETMEWIKFWLGEARKKNITVLALCHHEVTEPFSETAARCSAYVIKNHESVEEELADAGLRVIFGAYANDITMYLKDDSTFYNICAEYLLSPPHAYRMITMDPNYMHIETRYVTSIDATIPGGIDFLVYSNTKYQERMTNLLAAMFKVNPYNLPEGNVNTPGTAYYYGFHFAKALHAFYAGDEKFPQIEEAISQSWTEPYKSLLKSIYTDLPPNDLDFTVDMRKKLR